MARKNLITVLDLDGDRLTALHAVLSPGAVVLRSWLTAQRPDSVPAENPEAVAAWIEQQLEPLGMGRGGLFISMSRSDVVLKRLVFTAGPGLGDDDLAGMVRLQMSRQLTMPVDSAAIDYAPLNDPSGPSDASVRPEGGQMSILAGAMPGDRLHWCQGLAKALGMPLTRVSLRACGAAALVAERSQRHDRAVIAATLGFRTAEFVIVENGQMVFARAADVPRPAADTEIEAYADRIAVELRRTWTSYRVATPSDEAPLVAVLADGLLARQVGERSGRALDGSWEIVQWPASVDTTSAAASADRAAVTPLVGLLHELAIGQPALDFAHPRRARDRRARLRTRALAGALAAIVVLGGAGVAGYVALSGLRQRVATLEQTEADLRAELDRFLVEQARVSHMEAWTGAKVDWLSHIELITRQLPDPRESLADEISGSASTLIAFEPKGAYPSGRWIAAPTATFGVGGKVRSRDVATALRGRLIAGEIYRVETRGADVADRYSFEIQSAFPAPPGPGNARSGDAGPASTKPVSESGASAAGGGAS